MDQSASPGGCSLHFRSRRLDKAVYHFSFQEKTKMRSTFTGLIFFTSLFALGVPALAQDALKVAPNHYKVLLENDHVRVIENTLPPGARRWAGVNVASLTACWSFHPAKIITLRIARS